MTGLLAPRLTRPWLVADLGAPHRVLSFAPHNPGFVTAQTLVWREVKNADLPEGLDFSAWFAGELARAGLSASVAMLTARDIGTWRAARAEVGGVTVECLATVGLGNAEALGPRRPTRRPETAPAPGTINIALRLSEGLTDTALLEALSIAASARAATVLASGVTLADGRAALGTGTDCLALAAPAGAGAFAGLHTALGEAIGRAVAAAVGQGCADWVAENGSRADGYPEDLI